MICIQCLCFLRLRHVAVCQGVCQATRQTPYTSLESQFHSVVSDFKHNFYMKTKKKFKSNINLHVFLLDNIIPKMLGSSCIHFLSPFILFSTSVAWAFSVTYAGHCSRHTGSLPSGSLQSSADTNKPLSMTRQQVLEVLWETFSVALLRSAIVI